MQSLCILSGLQSICISVHRILSTRSCLAIQALSAVNIPFLSFRVRDKFSHERGVQ
jgi:hypothetical protein